MGDSGAAGRPARLRHVWLSAENGPFCAQGLRCTIAAVFLGVDGFFNGPTATYLSQMNLPATVTGRCRLTVVGFPDVVNSDAAVRPNASSKSRYANSPASLVLPSPAHP